VNFEQFEHSNNIINTNNISNNISNNSSALGSGAHDTAASLGNGSNGSISDDTAAAAAAAADDVIDDIIGDYGLTGEDLADFGAVEVPDTDADDFSVSDVFGDNNSTNTTY
jgi:hypothetical protein